MAATAKDKNDRVLDLIQYDEETVAVLEPRKESFYSNGVHTLTAVNDITLVDGKRHKYNYKVTKLSLK